MEFEASEDVGGGSGGFLNEPGTYHLIVDDVLDGKLSNGDSMKGFTLKLKALAGTVDGQAGNTVNLALFNAKTDVDASENGKLWARRKQTACLIAGNLLTPAQLGQKVSIDIGKLKDQQLVVKFTKDEDKKYLDLSFADIWHVDDPRAEAIPKCAEHLAFIPKTLRHDAAYFEPLLAKKAKSDSPAAPKVDLSDL